VAWLADRGNRQRRFVALFTDDGEVTDCTMAVADED
jgi:hypothetical protein